MWQNTGLVAGGGSVFNIHTNQTGQTWVVTGAGILHKTKQGWLPVAQSQPLPSLLTVSAAPSGSAWWAGGLTGQIVRTRDEARSWELCWLDQIAEPVVCMAPSPRYSTDHTVLAGTNGAGVLRSTDGGRRWFLSNFGLQDFTILALAVAPDWSRREIVFAGTLAGVYRSSGGGRAWKQTGLGNMAVQALAVSRQFTKNDLVLAGTEQGLYRSVDGGKSWQPVKSGPPAGTALNALLTYHQTGDEQWWAGTDDGALWQSVDDGQTWRRIVSADKPVLALAASPEGMLAGLSDDGLLISTDDGRTWRSDTPLFGRSWQRLDSTDADRLLAIAPNDGAWTTGDSGQGWQQIVEASFDRPLLAATALDSVWLAAWIDGLYRRKSDGEWQPVLSVDETSVAALAADNHPNAPVWAATIDCRLWRSDDRGGTWQHVDVPFAGQQLLALAISSQDSTVLVCSLNPLKKEVSLWRLVDDSWELWLRRPITAPYVQIVAAGKAAEESWLAIDTELWQYAAGQWQKRKTFEQTIRRATLTINGDLIYVLLGQALCYSQDGLEWTSIEFPQEAAPLVDLQVAAGNKLFALDITGVLWQTTGG